ncbi:hypothetical protein A6E01_20095 (plasmid) [Vibrio breoganii]|uniref:Uncharacterized protein n=1 Tax=Vibrio breoganii TaxID=553239 RepID=A0A193KIX1_9VIBR|nr:hypothetical protein [Vibrio breoganii]ANO35517.1 hypothetical protein A6E01_20095 [Vibrio breoganii]
MKQTFATKSISVQTFSPTGELYSIELVVVDADLPDLARVKLLMACEQGLGRPGVMIRITFDSSVSSDFRGFHAAEIWVNSTFDYYRAKRNER